MKDVSVIIVTRKRQKLLERLLEQVTANAENCEVIVIINGDNQDYQALKKRFPIIWIEGTYKTPGLARNIGIEKASHQWLLFLDDDTELPSNFITNGLNLLSQEGENVVVLGGPDQTPPKANYFSKALNLALSSPMATAHTRLRHTTTVQNIQQGDESNLILCNLWVNSHFIKEHHIRFNENLFRNEENLFINEIMKHGGQVKYYPNLFIYHHRKTRLDQLFKAVFSSGKHRMKSALFSKNLFSPLFLIPSFFVLYLVGLPLLKELPHGFTPLKIYLTLSLFMSLKLGPGLFWPMIFFYQIFINIGYGLGVLFGLFCLPFWSWRIRR